ncbi:MAG: nucleoside-diphosphate kinase [Bacteroidota bacterium]
MEQTFVAIKPDGLQRRIVGKVINRLEEKGFRLVGIKMLWMDRALAAEHYREHAEKPFFEPLIDFITSGPVIAMVWEGDEIIEAMRLMVGPTNGLKAPPGTIRGDYAAGGRKNLIHASDGPSAAEREINLFFKPEDRFNWESALAPWIR